MDCILFFFLYIHSSPKRSSGWTCSCHKRTPTIACYNWSLCICHHYNYVFVIITCMYLPLLIVHICHHYKYVFAIITCMYLPSLHVCICHYYWYISAIITYMYLPSLHVCICYNYKCVFAIICHHYKYVFAITSMKHQRKQMSPTSQFQSWSCVLEN